MPQYSPMQSVRALSGIQGAMGGQGLLWEGKEKGLSRRAIQAYVNEQARKATKAGRGIGLSQFGGKALGLLAMAIPGVREAGWLAQVLAGAGTAGTVSKLGGEYAARHLSREAGPDVLYGLEEKEEAESYAHSAVDTLLSSIDPGALKTAVTTPLEYFTMEMMSKLPQAHMGATAKGAQSGLGAYSPTITKQAADVGGLTWAQRRQLGQTAGLSRGVDASQSASSFWDLLSQQGWTPSK